MPLLQQRPHRTIEQKEYYSVTKERTIVIPKSLTSFSHVAALNIRDLDLDDIDQCIVNFSGTTYAEPFPMIALASDLRNLRNRFPNVKYVCRSKESKFRGYADHIGYFRFLGFSRGNHIGDASGSDNYVPIHLFDIDKMKAASGEEPYGKIVGEEALKLAEVLTRNDKGGVFIAIEYSLREILRNAIEHGMGSKMVVLGQYWPSKQAAEIVICDNGIGIAETLKDHYQIRDTFDALEKALLPGISGTSDLEREHQNPYYRNSGFGLYTTSKLCSERGVFRVVSGDGGLTIQSENTRRQKWFFDGTCVQMKIRTDALENSAARIREIIEEGEALGGNSQIASTASKQTSGWVD